MPRVPQKYEAVDLEQRLEPDLEKGSEQSVIQAQPITQPLLTEITIINADTPLIIRQNFITKVYIILWFQLLVTSTFIACCNQIKPLQKFMLSPGGQSIMWLCFVLSLVLTCSLLCLKTSIKKCPGSGLFLTLFTGSMTYIVGYAGIVYKLTTLLLAGMSTLGIFSGLTLYAVQTKYDYTDKGGYLISLLMCFIIFGFMISFVNLPVLSIVYSSVGSLIFSFYIVYDTQMIVGGEHRRIKFHTDDYVIAAISLYLDIINLFLYLLELLDGR